MDNLELLSDDELRRRLLQYGFENLPITQVCLCDSVWRANGFEWVESNQKFTFLDNSQDSDQKVEESYVQCK